MQPQEHDQPQLTQPRSKIEKEKVRDPVCGMMVTSGETAGGNATYEGEAYDFCSDECRERFEANPAGYVTPR